MSDADFKRYLIDLADARQKGLSPGTVKRPHAIGENIAREKAGASASVSKSAVTPPPKVETNRPEYTGEQPRGAGESETRKNTAASDSVSNQVGTRASKPNPVGTIESPYLHPAASPPNIRKQSSDPPTARKSVLARLWTLVKWLILAGVILIAAFVALGIYLDHRNAGSQVSANSSPNPADSSAKSSTGATAAQAPVGPNSAQPIGTYASAPSLDQSPSQTASSLQPTTEQVASALPASSSSAPAQSESPATISIRNHLTQPQASYGCGDLASVYCEATLVRQATRLAYDDSVKCDQSPEGGAACPADGDAFIARRVKELEVRALTDKKARLERYLTNPEKENFNTDGNTRLLAEPCEQQAVKRGVRGADFTAYVNGTCLPQARDAFLKPQRDLLAQVSARLAALVPDAQGAQQTQSTNASASDGAATGDPAAVGSTELRCGWIENDLPSSLALRDRNGTWHIVSDGASTAPDGFDQMPPTSRGSSCGCLTVQTSRQTMQITKIFNGKLKPLSACIQDKSLHQD